MSYKDQSTELTDEGWAKILGVILFTLVISIIIINYSFALIFYYKWWVKRRRTKINLERTTSVKIVQVRRILAKRITTHHIPVQNNIIEDSKEELTARKFELKSSPVYDASPGSWTRQFFNSDH
mmetsp:Transcript_15716/g.13742  ORF Transcript_15716/g.13742 Transcript_15716/m.13742 type:complete len:124 (+) Transcript_15716:60-431(+)